MTANRDKMSGEKDVDFAERSNNAVACGLSKN
jgi:hypothetical protein